MKSRYFDFESLKVNIRFSCHVMNIAIPIENTRAKRTPIAKNLIKKNNTAASTKNPIAPLTPKKTNLFKLHSPKGPFLFFEIH